MCWCHGSRLIDDDAIFSTCGPTTTVRGYVGMCVSGVVGSCVRGGVDSWGDPTWWPPSRGNHLLDLQSSPFLQQKLLQHLSFLSFTFFDGDFLSLQSNACKRSTSGKDREGGGYGSIGLGFGQNKVRIGIGVRVGLG